MKNWMKIETETIYGDKRVILYDSNVYDNDEKLNPAIQLADMYLNIAMPNKETSECDIIVLDKLTADFWFNIIEEQKEKAFKQSNKETAEKILNSDFFIFETENRSEEYQKGYMQAVRECRSRREEISKELGVEIKE